MISDRIVRDWYQGARWLNLLRPLSLVFERVARSRRESFLETRQELWRPQGVPIVIVGNITVGGTGKSPLVAALVSRLQEQGWKPGVISRGYGGKSVSYPLKVDKNTPVAEAGDEPVMLAGQVRCPIVVDPDRVRAAKYILEISDCDVIVSDDGLQHYRLWRDVEIVVMDGARGLGNRLCLPAGPLREPPERLESVDALVCNGGQQFRENLDCWNMQLAPVSLVRLADGGTEDPLAWKGRKVHAIAGIGHPGRFFRSLQDLGMVVIPHAFPDHHRYNSSDLTFDDDLPVVMTDKDAVKCRHLARDQLFVLRVQAILDSAFYAQIQDKLNLIRNASENHG